MKSWKRRLLQASTAVIAGSVLSAGLGAITQGTAAAQAAYGSYIGVGPSFSLFQGGGANEGRTGALVVAARYKFLELPISVRAQALLFSGTTAVIPVVSYDFPLNWQTDAYIGAGYSFSDGDSASPVGNKSSFVLQPGVDYMIPDSNLVIFGNAVFAFDGYRSGGSALSLQGGLGLRF